MKIETLCEKLKDIIKNAYETGVTLDEAEKLAAQFLYGQIMVAEELKRVDLDARMKKSGNKAVRAAVYMQEATKGDKKPSDVLLQNMVEMNELVVGEQNRFDEAEVARNALENYLNIFKDGHIYFRGISRGRME